jgi:hypothetical protein
VAFRLAYLILARVLCWLALLACDRKHTDHEDPARAGEGSIPALRRIFQSLDVPIWLSTAAEAGEFAVDASVAPGGVAFGVPELGQRC